MPFKPFNLYEAMSGGQNMAMNQLKIDETGRALRARAGLSDVISAGTPGALENYRKQFPMEALDYESKLFARSKGIREQEKYNQEQQRANTEWLVGATDQVLQDPSALPGLFEEGKRRKIIDPNATLDGIDIEKVRELNKRAKVALGSLPDPGALEKVVGPDGKAKYVRRADALGQQPLVSDNKGRGDYIVPVQTADGVFGFNTRTGRYVDPSTGKDLDGKRIVGSSSDPNLQRRLAGVKAYSGQVSKDVGEADVKLHESAISSATNIHKIDTLLDHLKTSDAITGMGADILKNIERAKVFFAGSEKAGKKVSDTELLDVMMGSDVFPMIGALGIGARGLDTPAEREFLRQVMTGTIPMNKQTLIRMTEMRRDIQKRAIEKFNKRLESGELDKYFEISGRPKEKIEFGQAQKDPLGIRR